MPLSAVVCLSGLLMLLALPDRSAEEDNTISGYWWLRFLAFGLLTTGLLLTIMLVALRAVQFLM